MSRPMPPSGANPPAQAQTARGTTIELVPLARDICRRYRTEFPDEEERYGAAGDAWCVHDNQYLLAWAIQDARDGTVVLDEQAVWLATVLHARGFPVARLIRDLDLAADVASAGIDGEAFSGEVAHRLATAALAVGRWSNEPG